jgi:citronellol/citronellal dehydrogenase
MWWEPILATPPRRMALMYEVNLRASYLASYFALPHLVRGGWGHVVVNSPPIVPGPYGFSLYNTTKMGMTRLAIGLGTEHREDNVAGNSLWPATPIDSYATRNWSDEKMGRPDQRRSPQIMCDALLELVTSAPRSCTARQLVDEPFLRERGWDDARIDAYWLQGRPADPLWIDGREALTAG